MRPRKSGKRYLQIFLYVFIFIGMVFAMGIARDCRGIHTTSREGNSGGDTIDIAVIYAPGSLYSYGDSLGGLNKEIADAFSKDEGLPIRIWPVAYARRAMDKLSSEDFDILASLPLDNSIRDEFPTSESLFLDRLVLIELTDTVNGTGIASSLDLNGKSVHIASGSPALQRLSNLSKEIGGDIEIVEENKLSDELLALKVARGEIKLGVVNEKTALAIKKKYPQLKVNNPVSFTQFQVWLFNPADTLLQRRFNEWFDGFRDSEAYREIIDKY